MSKNTLKIIIIIIDLLASIAAIAYLAKMFKSDNKAQDSVEDEPTISDDDSLHAREAVDFSDLKFSRNYVDLR